MSEEEQPKLRGVDKQRATYYQIMEEGEHQNKVVVLIDINHPEGTLVCDGKSEFHISYTETNVEVLTVGEVLNLINDGVVM